MEPNVIYVEDGDSAEAKAALKAGIAVISDDWAPRG